MTNEELVIRIRAGIDVPDNMLQLYSQVRNFIYSVAMRFQAYEEIDDLLQEGYLALYDAVDGYDPDSGNKFLTYASWHFRQRMQRYVMDKGSCLRLPAGKNEKLLKYKKLCNQYRLEIGRDPSDREIAYCLGWSWEQIQDIKDLAVMSQVGSLDSPVAGKGGTIGDMVVDPERPEDEVIDRMQREQLKSVLWDCVDHLEGKAPDIIRKRYIEDQTRKEIAEGYGVTNEMIRQYEMKALRELRMPRNRRRLEPYLDEISSDFLYGVGVDQFRRTWTSSTEYAAMRLLDGWAGSCTGATVQ